MFKQIAVAVMLSCLVCGSVFADEDDESESKVDQLKETASHGNIRSQLELSSMYENGRIVPQNYKKELYWLRKAAKQNNTDAEFAIGKMYKLGHGVPQDDQQAAEWFAKSAAHRPS